MLIPYMSPLPNNPRDIIDRIPSSPSLSTGDQKLIWMRLTVLDLIASNKITDAEIECLAPFCKVLDMSSVTEPLLAMWEANVVNRLAVLGAIFHTFEGARLFESLNEIDRIKYSDPWITPMIKFAPQQPFARHALGALWSATTLQGRIFLYNKIDTIRTRNNISDEIYSELMQYDDFREHHENIVYH